MEWMVHETRSRYNTDSFFSSPDKAREAILRLELRPVHRVVGGLPCTGFSYQYSYKSAELPVYKILDKGSWEPGGTAVGNELWMRNTFGNAIESIEQPEQPYSTQRYLSGIRNPHMFQFLPLQTELQGFTFTANKRGVLVTWVNQVSHVRSLMEKPEHTEVIGHFHEHCSDLECDFSTAPVEVLWCDRVGPTRAARENFYYNVQEMVQESLHNQAGLRRERIKSHGMIEEGKLPDLDHYRKKGIPALMDQGIQWIYLANHFQNNMNVYGISNNCCTIDLHVAESVGEDRLSSLCRDIKQRGGHVEMWCNTAFSTINPLLYGGKKNADPEGLFGFTCGKEDTAVSALGEETDAFICMPNGKPDADHYTPRFACLNLRNPSVHSYWMRRWKYAHETIGLDGIFLDSSFNISSDKFDWSINEEAKKQGAVTTLNGRVKGIPPRREDCPKQAIKSQYHAHVSLISEMQRNGYRYCNEDHGVFGIHRHGACATICHNSLFMWSDCLANFDLDKLQEAGLNADAVFFQGLAFRMMWIIYWHPSLEQLSFCHSPQLIHSRHQPNAWHLSCIRAFDEIESLMRNGREVLEDNRGVLYHNENQLVVWAFKRFEISSELPMHWRNILEETEGQTGRLDCSPNSVYTVKNSKSITISHVGSAQK